MCTAASHLEGGGGLRRGGYARRVSLRPPQEGVPRREWGAWRGASPRALQRGAGLPAHAALGEVLRRRGPRGLAGGRSVAPFAGQDSLSGSTPIPPFAAGTPPPRHSPGVRLALRGAEPPQLPRRVPVRRREVRDGRLVRGLRRGGYARRVSLRPPQGVPRREWRSCRCHCTGWGFPGNSSPRRSPAPGMEGRLTWAAFASRRPGFFAQAVIASSRTRLASAARASSAAMSPGAHQQWLRSTATVGR